MLKPGVYSYSAGWESRATRLYQTYPNGLPTDPIPSDRAGMERRLAAHATVSATGTRLIDPRLVAAALATATETHHWMVGRLRPIGGGVNALDLSAPFVATLAEASARVARARRTDPWALLLQGADRTFRDPADPPGVMRRWYLVTEPTETIPE